MACLHPVTLYRDGTYMRVPCGHCAGCLNQRGKLYSDLSEIESKFALATFFFTLTYDDNNVPICRIVPSAVDDQGVCEVTFQCVSSRLLGYYDKDIIDQIDVTNEHYQYIMRPLRDNRIELPSKFGYNCTTFCFKPDIINFLKRVRYYVSKIKSSNASLRYFLCSEYGPKTFRCHYHGLFFVYSSAVKERIPDIIRKAWPFGRIDVQLSGGCGCVSYVAKYVNSNSCLPSLYNEKALKTWTLHSQYYGSKSYASNYSSLEQITFESISRQIYVVSKHYVEGLRIPSLQNMLFPRCYRFSVSDFDLCLYRYKVFTTLSRLFGSCSVEEIVQKCTALNFDLPLGDYNLIDLLCLSENKESCLRSMLYLSRKFLRLCCKYNVSPFRYYQLIRSFYSDMDMSNLNSFYSKYEQDSMDKNRLPVDYIYRYGNLPLFSRSDYIRCFNSDSKDSSLVDSYIKIKRFAESIHVDPLICVDVLFDYENLYDYIENYRLQTKIASDNVKHKIINDLNKVLYG